MTFPSLQAMTARWIPPEERTSFIARSFFSSTFGLIFTFPLCGFLSNSLGWEAPFYVIGALTLVWYVFWIFFVYDSPDDHPRISPQEKELIKTALGATVNNKVNYPVPWRAILTSIPFLGLITTDVCNSWGIMVLGYNGPTFLKYMLNINIKLNGLVSGLPMMSRYLGGVFHSIIADWMTKKKWLSVVWIRRIFNSISQFTPAFAMLVC